MNYMHVWSCAAEAKLFNPSLGKLDPKTESRYFIGYPEKSKGYKFYCPKGYKINMLSSLRKMDALSLGKLILRKCGLMTPLR